MRGNKEILAELSVIKDRLKKIPGTTSYIECEDVLRGSEQIDVVLSSGLLLTGRMRCLDDQAIAGKGPSELLGIILLAILLMQELVDNHLFEKSSSLN